jgi:hypothetical protein
LAGQALFPLVDFIQLDSESIIKPFDFLSSQSESAIDFTIDLSQIPIPGNLLIELTIPNPPILNLPRPIFQISLQLPIFKLPLLLLLQLLLQFELPLPGRLQLVLLLLQNVVESVEFLADNGKLAL